MLKELKPAVLMLVVFTLLTGGLYPALITGIAQAVMPAHANGSLLTRDGKPVGSALIGQPFSSPKYFWSRPSATSPYPYNAASSSGSNQGPSNSALTDAVSARVKALRDADPDNTARVPVDLVTASGSGLDPHISPAAAQYQIDRVARARNLDPSKVAALVAQYTEGRQLGVLGEAVVNVLALNLALEALH
jgi:K+-transporting ATPase ATPase C chain